MTDPVPPESTVFGASCDLRARPIHLGLGGTAQIQPSFTGMEWYEAYSARVAADGADGRLVSLYDFDADWDSWEMHPAGDEVVICLGGEMIVIQQCTDGDIRRETLRAGQAVVNPAGVWHTADVADSATALFITSGEGTAHRPR